MTILSMSAAAKDLTRHPHDDLQDRLGYRFKNQDLLGLALSHRSFDRRRQRRRNETADYSNERLEFLGDAVLGLLIARLLYEARPTISEGVMSRIRSTLVRNDLLARRARDLLLIQDHLRLGRRERQFGLQHSPVLAADALEAIIGAVFLDGGMDMAEQVVRRLFAREFSADIMPLASLDDKSELIRIVGRMGLGSVVFASGERSLDAPETGHVVSVYLKDQRGRRRLLTRAVGQSRRRAEQSAAKRGLELLTRNEEKNHQNPVDDDHDQNDAERQDFKTKPHTRQNQDRDSRRPQRGRIIAGQGSHGQPHQKFCDKLKVKLKPERDKIPPVVMISEHGHRTTDDRKKLAHKRSPFENQKGNEPLTMVVTADLTPTLVTATHDAVLWLGRLPSRVLQWILRVTS